MDLELQRKRAQAELPRKPLLLQGRNLQRWEVVLAYNLEYPLRFRQDYWWLEVLAEGPLQARAAGWEWVRSQGETRFECTDWVRPGSTHLRATYLGRDPLPLPIEWDVPLPGGWEPDTPVRHPATGRRLGFVSPDPLPPLRPEPEGDFYLLRHLPASGSDLVCLLPRVESTHEILLSQKKAEDGHTSGEPPEASQTA